MRNRILVRTQAFFLAPVALAMALLFVGAACAIAAPPFSAPVEITRLTFEPGSDAFTEIRPTLIAGEADPKAYWGIVNAVRYSGASSLWCAGTLYPSGAANPYGTYPSTTRGVAVKHLPQLADYHSATLRFRYLMPSLGGADAEAFRVGWYATGPGGGALGSTESHSAFATGASWSASRAFDLTAPSGAVNLSRRAGSISFSFFDRIEVYERPLTGAGVAIDDVVVSGFKFGPVRGLRTAYRAGEGVRVSWSAPAASSAAAAEETRAVAYRVWRSPAGADSWTELTSNGRVSATEIIDPVPAVTDRYDYAVQAWDAGSGNGRGPQSVIGYPEAPRLSVSAPSVSDYARVTITGRLTDPRGDALPSGTKVTIQVSKDNRTFSNLGTAYTRDDGTFSFIAKPTSTRYYRARFAGGTAFRAASSRPVKVVPRVALSTPVVPSELTSTKAFTLYGSLKPRHAAGTYPVRILRDRQVAGGVWQAYPELRARAYDYSTYTRYKVSVKLPAGVWRIRAYHPADSMNAATWTQYRYVEVKE